MNKRIESLYNYIEAIGTYSEEIRSHFGLTDPDSYDKLVTRVAWEKEDKWSPWFNYTNVRFDLLEKYKSWHRTILPNEIVIEIEEVRPSFIKEIVSTFRGLRYWVLFSGNKSLHLHILISPSYFKGIKELMEFRKLVIEKMEKLFGLKHIDFVDQSILNAIKNKSRRMIRLPFTINQKAGRLCLFFDIEKKETYWEKINSWKWFEERENNPLLFVFTFWEYGILEVSEIEPYFKRDDFEFIKKQIEIWEKTHGRKDKKEGEEEKGAKQDYTSNIEKEVERREEKATVLSHKPDEKSKVEEAGGLFSYFRMDRKEQTESRQELQQLGEECIEQLSGKLEQQELSLGREELDLRTEGYKEGGLREIERDYWREKLDNWLIILKELKYEVEDIRAWLDFFENGLKMLREKLLGGGEKE